MKKQLFSKKPSPSPSLMEGSWAGDPLSLRERVRERV
jgi:hypothetical protein